MGIDLEIRKQMQSTYAPKAWIQTGLPPLSAQAKGRVRYIDSLCTQHTLSQALQFMRSGRPNNSLTTSDLAKLFLKPIYQHFNNSKSPLTVLILTLDDDFNTPSEKGRTQKQRTDNRPKYPADVTFEDTGVRMPKSSQVELIDYSKVMATRAIRKKLWEFFRLHLCKARLPDNAIVILNYDKSGPWVFQSNKQPVKRTEWAHQLGESDLAVLFFMQMFHDHDFIYETEDTDAIPIVFSFLGHPETKKPHRVLWEYPTKNNNQKQLCLVDMKQAFVDTLNYTKLSVEQFVLACILCKSDFYDKQLVSAQISGNTIFEAVQCSKSYLFPKFTENLEEGMKLFIQVLYTVYFKDSKGSPKRKLNEQNDSDLMFSSKNMQKKIKSPSSEIAEMFDVFAIYKNESIFSTTSNSNKVGTVVEELDEKSLWSLEEIEQHIQQKDYKKIKYPTQIQITQASNQLEFNLHYWLKSWLSYTVNHPAPEQLSLACLGL